MSHDNDRLQLAGLVIAEVKQSKFDRNATVRKTFKSLGIRELRISKYGLGSLHLKPYLKHNRFRAKANTVYNIAHQKGHHGKF